MLAFLAGLVPVLAYLSSPVAAQSASDVNNIAVLNQALFMSNMNSAYFNCFLAPVPSTYTSLCAKISPAAPTGFTVAQFLDAGYPQNVFDALVTLGNQEAMTASYLTGAINTARANSAYPVCNNYAFTNTTSVVSYLRNGAYLMANTLAFYNGGLNGLNSGDFQTTMASLGSVKGRHTAFLNNLVNTSFVADTINGFDMELPPAVANASTASYQRDCSNVAWVAPTIRPYGVSRSSSNGTAYTGPQAEAARAVYGQDARNNDIAAMNYFLSIESLAVSYFSNLTSTFTAPNFASAGYGSNIYAAVQQMANDDRNHISAYVALLPAYGGVPIANCTYNFTTWTQNVSTSLAAAALLVRVGVNAYNGRLNAITDTVFQQAAATVATVHSRHASILDLIQGGWNGTFIVGNQTNHASNFIDTSMTPEQVLAAIRSTGVDLSCPVTIPQPGVAPAAQLEPSSSTGSSSSSSSTGNSGTQAGLSAALLLAIVPMLFL